MGLTGLDACRKITAGVVALAKVPSQVAAEACDRIELAIHEQFDLGVDPFGQPWEPLAPVTIKRGRRPPPLTDTGELRNVTVSPSSGAGLTVEFGRPDIAQIHQKGAKYLPARQIWPNNARELKQSSWGKAIAEAYAESLDKALAPAGLDVPSASDLAAAAE